MEGRRDEVGNLKASNTWSKYELYVMETLAALKEEVIQLRRDIRDLRADMSSYEKITAADIRELKVRSGIYGLVGGMIPAIATLVYFLLK
ncbi:MAG: hypothetical protein ACXAEN_26890 [Candidatus Thorarchaeota archaeon]|jgi:hypothetical protein